MGQLKYFLCFILSFISFRRAESTNIYVVDFHNEKDSTNDYDDNNHVNDVEFLAPINYKLDHNHKKYIQDEDEMNLNLQNNILLCLSSTNEKQLNTCLNNVKNNARSNSYAYFKKPIRNFYDYSLYHNGEKRQKKNKRFLDLSSFSQDYFDVTDLGRSDQFSKDYIDFNDFRIFVSPECNSDNIDQLDEVTKSRCIRASRKANSGRQEIVFDKNYNNINVGTKKKKSRARKEASSESSYSKNESFKSSDELKPSGTGDKSSEKENKSFEKEDKSYEEDDNSSERENNSSERENKSFEKEDNTSEEDNKSSARENKSSEEDKEVHANEDNISLDKVDKSSEEDDKSSEKEDMSPYKHKLKPPNKDKRFEKNRYKVISYKNDDSFDNNDNQKLHKSNSEFEEFARDVDVLFPKSDFSAEITTKNPKKPKTKDPSDDGFVYLQGNKFYDRNDFRRRLPTFLSKRVRWDQDEYKNLGYFWFQGPKGKYPSQRN